MDATTSASVLLPGNAAQIAAWIQQKAGGDLFPIIVSEPYSSDYDECLVYELLLPNLSNDVKLK